MTEFSDRLKNKQSYLPKSVLIACCNISLLAMLLATGCAPTPLPSAPDTPTPIWRIDTGAIEYDFIFWDEAFLKTGVDAAGNSYVAHVAAQPSEIKNYTLTQYDTNGQQTWSVTFLKSAITDYQRIFLQVDAQGNSYIFTNFVADAALNDTDWLIAKYDALGNLAWERTQSSPKVGTNSHDYPAGMILGDNNQLYVYGTYSFIHESSTDVQLPNLVVTAYDLNGNPLWETTTGPIYFTLEIAALYHAGHLYLRYNDLSQEIEFVRAQYNSAGTKTWELRESIAPNPYLEPLLSSLVVDPSLIDPLGNVYYIRSKYDPASTAYLRSIEKWSSSNLLIWQQPLTRRTLSSAVNSLGELFLLLSESKGATLAKYNTDGQLISEKHLGDIPNTSMQLTIDSQDRVYVIYNAKVSPFYSDLWSNITIYDATLNKLGIINAPYPASSRGAIHFDHLGHLYYGKLTISKYALDSVLQPAVIP